MRITEAQLRKIIRQKIQEAIKPYSNDPNPPKTFSGSGRQEAQPLATFKLGEILKAVIPTNDKHKEELSSFIASLNQELQRLGAKSAQEAVNIIKTNKDTDANIIEKGGKYYVKAPKFNNIFIGDKKQIVDFARITGIQVKDLPKETKVYSGLPPKSNEMGALTNKIQGGTYGLGKGIRENKRK